MPDPQPGGAVRYLVDTNVLLRSVQPHAPEFPAASQALAILIDRLDTLCVTSQSLVEFYVVATRPQDVNGLGLDPDEALDKIAAIQRVMELLPDTPALYEEWARLVETYEVRGKPAHDAKIAAAMVVHGIDRILTFNGRDFRRYPVTVVDPNEFIEPTNS